jgi:spermidine/putrescine transport system substrate-binding protein
MIRIALALALLAGASAPRAEVRVLTWPDYFAKDTLSAFEKEFGCKVVLDHIESSETIRVKLEGGKSGYDVVFPSDEVVPALIAGGLLEKLDPARLPNLKNIAPQFRGLAYDPKNEHSVPYMWGTTGIAYRKDRVSPAPDSWAALWDPKVASRATLLDDAREAFAAAIWLEGGDPMAPGAPAIEKGKARLLAAKVLAFESSPKDRLLRGEAWISQAFNGDALQAAEELEDKIGYVIPKEGGTLWIDNLCVAKGSPSPDLAHKFIDYLLRPQVSAAITNEMYFANPNQEAQKHIKKEVLENPLVYPGPEDLKRCKLLGDLPPDLKKKMDDAWAEVKASAAASAGGSSYLMIGGVAVVLVILALLVLSRK